MENEQTANRTISWFLQRPPTIRISLHLSNAQYIIMRRFAVAVAAAKAASVMTNGN